MPEQEKTPMPETPETAKEEKREEYYERIEKKLEIVKQLWRSAQELPVPSENDSLRRIKNEGKKLLRHEQEALALFPKAKTGLEQIAEIQKEIQAIPLDTSLLEENLGEDNEWDKQYGEKISRLWEQEDALLEDEDIEFARNINNGLRTALKKRDKVRQLLRAAPGKQIGKELPRNYQELYVLKTLPQKFSAALFVSEESFKKVSREPVCGFYIPDTVFTVIPVNTEGRVLFTVFGSQQDIGESTVKHEDFHSFIEGFRQSPSYIKSEGKKIMAAVTIVEQLKKMDAPRELIEDNLQRLGRFIKLFQDKVQEELLAELASVAHRRNPARGVVYHVAKLTKFLETQVRGRDPEIDALLDANKRHYDSDALRRRLAMLYEKVATETPEKIEDLDAAFALFPLSKLNRIERLAQRWQESKNNS